MYIGDFKEDGDIFFKFTTRAFATGVPTTLSGSPVLSVYKDEGGAATEKTTAETYFDLDVDHDSIAGWNNVRLDLSGDAFFATGADYSIVITTGTVDSVNVFGETLANFSIENRSMGQPTGATLAVDISDLKSRLVIIESSVDSDQTSRTTAISDVKSRLVVVEAAADSDSASAATIAASMASSVEVIEAKASDTHSRLVVVEAAVDSDQTSRTAAVSDIHSRVVVIESSIDSDQTSRTAAISDVKSALTVAASDVALLFTAHAEPTGAPAANEAPMDKLAYLFAGLRNKLTITNSAKTFYDDAGVSLWSKTLNDDDTTYSETEGS